jgi:hypothetical protein
MMVMDRESQMEAIEFFGAIASAIRAGELPLNLAIELESDDAARLWPHVDFEVGGADLTLALMPWRTGEIIVRVIERLVAIQQETFAHRRIGTSASGVVYQLDHDFVATQFATQFAKDVLLLRRLWEGDIGTEQASILDERYKPELWRYDVQAFVEALHLIQYFKNPAASIRRSVVLQQSQASRATFGGDAQARLLAWDVIHLAEDAGVSRPDIQAIFRFFGPPSASEALEAAEYNARHAS